MKTILFSFILLVVIYSNAQNGAFDFTYNHFLNEELVDGSGPLGGLSSPVVRIIEQSDGKLLIAGEFGGFNEQYFHEGIVRIFPNGKIDTSFHNVTMNSVPSCMVLQPDGKIILGGYFDNVNGQPCSKIVRFESNGEIDPTFVIGSGINGYVNDLLLDSNGKLIVVGNIVDYNGIPQSDIIRLNLDGTIDASFNVGSGPDLGDLKCIDQMPDGSYFVGGSFSSFNGVTSHSIVHINSVGSVIPSFNSGISQYSYINRIKHDMNNNLFLSGTYFEYNNVLVGDLFSIDTLGNLNTAFSIPAEYGEIRDFVFTNASNIIAVGSFSESYGSLGNYIVSYELDGSQSSSVNFRKGLNSDAHTVVISSSNKIIVGGGFELVNGAYRPKLARFEMNGEYDPSLLPIPGPNAQVNKILSLDNGKSIVVGEFSHYNGIPCSGLVKLDSDGLIDNSFSFQMSSYTTVQDIVKIPSGGYYLICSMPGSDTIVRINENGILDGSFVENVSGYTDFKRMVLQPNGKLLVSGNIGTGWNNQINGGIIRLNSDGSQEANFFLSYSVSASVEDFDVFPNGKIILTGYNSASGSAWGTYVYRFNEDGSSDLGFNYEYMTSGIVTDLMVLPSGKTMILGGFTSYDGFLSYSLVRINYDGTVDPTFYVANNSFTPNNGMSLKMLVNGEILVAGGTKYLHRLLPDGSVNPNFQIHAITNGHVNSMAVQADGSVLLGGSFKGELESNYRVNMIKIQNDIQEVSDIQLGFSILKDSVNCPDSAYCTAFAYFGTPPYEFEWIGSIPLNNSPSQFFTIGGDYDLNVTDATGNMVTYTLHIYGPSMPCVLDLVESDKLDCQVYPNPFTSDFEIHLIPEKEILFEIYTTYGKRIFEGVIANDITKVNFSDVPSGAYLLKIKTKENQIYNVQKIVKY